MHPQAAIPGEDLEEPPSPSPRRLHWVRVGTHRGREVLLLTGSGEQALCLEGSQADATALVQAAAVLGDGAQLRHAAALAQLSLEAAAVAAETLANRRVLMSGTPLRFVDAFAQAAAYREIPAVVRGLRHGEAARLLADEGADPELVCGHVLASEPMGSYQVVAWLREAAERAVARGDADLGLRYLTRALSETPDVRVRRDLLHELGRTARVSRSPRAAEHLFEAVELCGEGDDCSAVAADLAEVLLFAGARSAAREVVEQHTLCVSGGGPSAPAAAAAEATTIVLAAYDTHRGAAFERRLERLRARNDAGGAPPLCGVLSGVFAWRGELPALVRALVSAFLEAGARDAWDESASLPIYQALLAVLILDDADRARALTGQLRGVARARGSVTAEVLDASARATLGARAGELSDAEGALHAVVDLTRNRATSLILPFTLCFAVDLLLERPGLAAIVPGLDADTPEPLDEHTVDAAMLHEVRGRLALADGNACEARHELEAAGALYDTLKLHAANATGWRTALATALVDVDDARAVRLAEAELEAARRAGSARSVGIALRTRALLEPGSRRIGYLEEAVAALAPSRARLEHARALVDLGAALRRANRRAASRHPLRAGLDLANRCGAHRLSARALVELRSTGARPRRAMLSGAASLTTAERRVADLAVQGLSNPEIARALFVTINTVEGHLRHAYQKLSIHSRAQLSDALQNQP